MAGPARQNPGASDASRYAPGPDVGANWLPDIVELIMADHRRIRRLCDAVYDIARHVGQPGPDWILRHVWQRLADVLVAHTRAEEETCYASVSSAGRQAAGPLRDSIAEHDAIRAMIDEVSLHPVGSAPWWHAVRTVIAVSAEHHEREERDVLPGCVLGLGMNQRRELGRQWCAFMAAWRRDAARRTETPLPSADTGTLPRLIRARPTRR